MRKTMAHASKSRKSIKSISRIGWLSFVQTESDLQKPKIKGYFTLNSFFSKDHRIYASHPILNNFQNIDLNLSDPQVETAGFLCRLQACMQGSFFMKPRKFSDISGGDLCRITLHVPLLQLSLKINTVSSPT